jgi:hypothetical protein
MATASPYTGAAYEDPRSAVYGRVRRITRWVLAAAAAATAVIVGVVANEIPGRAQTSSGSAASSAGATQSPTSSSSSGSASTTGGAATSENAGSAGSQGFAQPPVAPAPTQQAPVAVTGGTSW